MICVLRSGKAAAEGLVLTLLLPLFFFFWEFDCLYFAILQFIYSNIWPPNPICLLFFILRFTLFFPHFQPSIYHLLFFTHIFLLSPSRSHRSPFFILVLHASLSPFEYSSLDSTFYKITCMPADSLLFTMNIDSHGYRSFRTILHSTSRMSNNGRFLMSIQSEQSQHRVLVYNFHRVIRSIFQRWYTWGTEPFCRFYVGS